MPSFIYLVLLSLIACSLCQKIPSKSNLRPEFNPPELAAVPGTGRIDRGGVKNISKMSKHCYNDDYFKERVRLTARNGA